MLAPPMPKTLLAQEDEWGLSIEERKFCDLVLTGTPRYIAIAEAGFRVEAKSGNAASRATEILKKPRVAAYMAAMRKHAVEISGMTREQFLQDLVNTLRSTPNDADMDNPLCEIDYVGKDGDAVPRFMSKSKAALLIMKMLGWEAPKKLEVSGSVQIIEYDLDIGGEATTGVIRSSARPMTPAVAKMVQDREEAIEAEAEEVDFDTEELEEIEEPEPPKPKPKSKLAKKLSKNPPLVTSKPGAKSLRAVIAKETPLLKPARRV